MFLVGLVALLITLGPSTFFLVCYLAFVQWLLEDIVVSHLGAWAVWPARMLEGVLLFGLMYFMFTNPRI